jgi:hypothetical protein
MDLKDEEQRMYRPPETPIAAGRGGIPEYGGRETCERCGRQVDTLYSVRGKRLCATCMSDDGGKPPAGADTFSSAIKVIWDIGEKVGVVAREKPIKNAAGEKEKAGSGSGFDEGGKGRGGLEKAGIAGSADEKSAAGGKGRGLIGWLLGLFGFGRGKKDEKNPAADFEKEKERSEFEEIGKAGGGTGKKFSVKGRKFVGKGKKG